MIRYQGPRLFLAALAALAVTLSTASVALAAAPRIMIVTGDDLSRPVVLDDWQENLAIMTAATNRPLDRTGEDLDHRPSYRIGMFWGSDWNAYVEAGKDPGALHLDQANQLGRYYPPTRNHAAVFTFDAIPGPGALIRRLEPEGVAVFARHRIGHASAGAGSNGSATHPPVALMGALATGGGLLLALSLWALRHRRLRRPS